MKCLVRPFGSGKRWWAFFWHFIILLFYPRPPDEIRQWRLLCEKAALWVVLFWVVDHTVYFQGMKGKIDEYSDSDEDQHDAYLERMKAEGKIREEGNDSDESDSGSGEWLFQHVRGRHYMLNLEDHQVWWGPFFPVSLFRWVFQPWRRRWRHCRRVSDSWNCSSFY